VPRHRARPRAWAPRRAYLAVAAGVAVLAVALIAVHIATGSAAGVASTSIRPTQPETVVSSPHVVAPSPQATPRITETPSASTSPTSSTQPPSASAVQPPPSATASPALAAADSVLAVINQARARAGLPAYTISSGLELSSSRHNQLMADGCGLSHQCQGEPSLGARETAAGVQWTAAGENIGEGGPVADTSAAITQMAVALTQDMLNEKPPDDGHRLNILSSTFTHIGITIQRSADGTVWMTQDFSN
jgi:uncharacterized protein YkwD